MPLGRGGSLPGLQPRDQLCLVSGFGQAARFELSLEIGLRPAFVVEGIARGRHDAQQGAACRGACGVFAVVNGHRSSLHHLLAEPV